MGKGNRISFIMILIFIIVILLGVFILIAVNSGNSEDVDNFFQTGAENTVLNDNEEKSIVENFLANEKLISTSADVDAGYPSGYYFSKDGSFVYYIGDEYVTKNGQVISFRGSWKIEENKLILKCIELQTADGGRVVNSNGTSVKHIEDYERVLSKVNYIKEYEIKELTDEFIKLGDEKFYGLSVNDQYIDELKDIAINGY